MTATRQPDQQDSDFPKLASPALRALARAGYTRLEQLAKVSEAKLMKLHGMGPNALNTLRQALAKRGLSFAAGRRGESQ